MSRVRELATIVLTLGLGASTVALAESQADIANRENDEGKELMYASKYPDASAKFRDAVARVPEPKYFLNLCASLYQEGKFGEALTVVQLRRQGADERPDDKPSRTRSTSCRSASRTRRSRRASTCSRSAAAAATRTCRRAIPNVPPNNPPPGNDPNNPPPTNPPAVNPNRGQPSGRPPGGQQTVGAAVRYQPIIGRPPEQNLFRAVQPNHNYTWTLGVDVFAGGASFQGTVNGGGDAFGTASERRPRQERLHA